MQKRYLTEEEQRRLLNAARGQNTARGQRDYHWMAALILTGMRVQEWSQLKVHQVRLGLASGWLVSRREHCKGQRKANEYCVTQGLRVHLQWLIDEAERVCVESGFAVPADGMPLVWGRDIAGRAGSLSVRSYEARLKGWAVLAGLDERISPHWMRHTRGMNVMRRSRGDAPLKVAQIALNHASLSSTGIYLQMNREEVARELALVDGTRMPKRLARRLAMTSFTQGAAA